MKNTLAGAWKPPDFCTFNVDKIVSNGQDHISHPWFIRDFLPCVKTQHLDRIPPLQAIAASYGPKVSTSAHFMWIRLWARPTLCHQAPDF
jgi:hypothetical protein